MVAQDHNQDVQIEEIKGILLSCRKAASAKCTFSSPPSALMQEVLEEDIIDHLRALSVYSA